MILPRVARFKQPPKPPPHSMMARTTGLGTFFPSRFLYIGMMFLFLCYLSVVPTCACLYVSVTPMSVSVTPTGATSGYFCHTHPRLSVCSVTPSACLSLAPIQSHVVPHSHCSTDGSLAPIQSHVVPHSHCSTDGPSGSIVNWYGTVNKQMQIEPNPSGNSPVTIDAAYVMPPSALNISATLQLCTSALNIDVVTI